MAVARPAHRRARPDDGHAVGDVVDRHLPVDLGSSLERLRHRGLERVVAARRAAPEAPARRAPDWRIWVANDIASRIWRGSGSGASSSTPASGGPEIALAAALLEERAREVEAHVVGVDQASIEAKGAVCHAGARAAAAARSNTRPPVRVDDADLGARAALR